MTVNSIMTEKELRKLYNDSQFFQMETAQSASQKVFEEDKFVSCADDILESFTIQPETSGLFGNSSVTIPNRLCFSPLFNYIKKRFDYSKWKGFFCEGAFGEWEDAFTSALDRLFGILVFQQLEDAVGVMTFPYINWIQEKAISYIQSGELFKAIAKSYPLCARQLIEFTYLQAEHILEILSASTIELPLHLDFFFEKENPGRITCVSASDSDYHNGGRSVHVLDFEDGSRLVYKPHDLKMDRAQQKWINWCAKKAGEEEYLTPKCVDTKIGGFCTFITSKSLERREDAARFFHRVGFLLGLIYLMHGNDLHCENIYAVGSEPVIIDTETLIAPEKCLLRRLTEKKYRYTVTDMTILPTMMGFPGLRESKYAGLCYSMPGSHNLPEFDGEKITGREYGAEVSEGFRLAVMTVLQNVEEAQREFCELFEGCSIRSVVRTTASYGRLLAGLCHSSCQSDSQRYKALLERIKITANTVLKEDSEMVAQEENAALFRLDIPFFSETMTREMADEMVMSWKSISEQTIAQDTKRIIFGLTKTDPRGGMSEESCKMKDIDKEADIETIINSGVERQARVLEELLNKQRVPIATTCELGDYIVNEALAETNGILDGSLGVFVALSAYACIKGDTVTKLYNQLTVVAEKLTDATEVSPVLTGSDLSLAAGGAGYIVGMYMCYRMGTVTRDQLHRAIDNLSVLDGCPDKIKYSPMKCIYGSYDFLYALSILPEEFKTDKLKHTAEKMAEVIKNHTQSEIINMVEDEFIVSEGSDRVVNNNSLRFGNSGKLLRFADRSVLSIEQQKASQKLACALAQAEHIIEGEEYPEGYLETGLLNGMPGVLYSLCRFLAPDRIPGLGKY